MEQLRLECAFSTLRTRDPPDGKHLQWISNPSAPEPEILDQDPDFDAWTRLKSMLLSTFVAEEQL